MNKQNKILTFLLSLLLFFSFNQIIKSFYLENNNSNLESNNIEKLYTVNDTLLNTTNLSIEQRKSLIQQKNKIAATLKAFKVQNGSISVDPNLAFIFDTLNPSFTIQFKNEENEIKKQKYKAQINGIGFSFDLSIRIDKASLIKSNLTYLDKDKELIIDKGINISLNPISWLSHFKFKYYSYINFLDTSNNRNKFYHMHNQAIRNSIFTKHNRIPWGYIGFNYTIVTFKNITGYLVLKGLHLGPGFSFSYITGGKIIPVND